QLVLSRKRLEACRQEAESAKQLWERQLERDNVSAQLEKLQDKSNDIHELEQRLTKAEWSAAAMPYLEHWETAKAQHLSAGERLQRETANYEAAAARYAEVKAIQEAAHQEWSEREPKLIALMEQYKQAVDWERELQRLEREAAMLREQAEHSEQQGRELAAQWKEQQEKQEKAVQKQA